MRTQPNAQENSATFITPPVQSRMPWRVTSIQVLPHFRLSVCFVDGTQGIIDLSHSVHSPNAGVFAALRDPVLFEQAYVEHGAVTWPGEIDWAPDAMYAQIRQSATT